MEMHLPNHKLGILGRRMQTIGIMAYKTKILELRVMDHYSPHGHLTTSVVLWQGDLTPTPTPTQGICIWEVLTIQQLTFPSSEIVAAYDGKSTVTIIQNSGSVMRLDLDTTQWKITPSDPTLAFPTPCDSVWAFHMKLKFWTAI